LHDGLRFANPPYELIRQLLAGAAEV